MHTKIELLEKFVPTLKEETDKTISCGKNGGQYDTITKC